MRLGPGAFLVFNGIGAAIWVAAGLLLGWLLHEQIESLLAGLNRMGGYAALLLGCMLFAWLTWKWWERHRFLAQLRSARISVEALYELMQGGHEPVLLDVRTASARAVEGKMIPGSRFVDFTDPDRGLAGVHPQADIIVYCS
jgi:hypothetical protein